MGSIFIPFQQLAQTCLLYISVAWAGSDRASTSKRVFRGGCRKRHNRQHLSLVQPALDSEVSVFLSSWPIWYSGKLAMIAVWIEVAALATTDFSPFFPPFLFMISMPSL